MGSESSSKVVFNPEFLNRDIPMLPEAKKVGPARQNSRQRHQREPRELEKTPHSRSSGTARISFRSPWLPNLRDVKHMDILIQACPQETNLAMLVHRRGHFQCQFYMVHRTTSVSKLPLQGSVVAAPKVILVTTAMPQPMFVLHVGQTENRSCRRLAKS